MTKEQLFRFIGVCVFFIVSYMIATFISEYDKFKFFNLARKAKWIKVKSKNIFYPVKWKGETAGNYLVIKGDHNSGFVYMNGDMVLTNYRKALKVIKNKHSKKMPRIYKYTFLTISIIFFYKILNLIVKVIERYLDI